MTIVKAECGCSFDIIYTFKGYSGCTWMEFKSGVSSFAVKSSCETHSAFAREEALKQLKERHAKELEATLE
jgi:hypothetical protein